MNGEMRVTVVATGIGSQVAGVEKTGISLVSPKTEKIVEKPVEASAIIEEEPVLAQASGGEFASGESADLKYLDIPAFLRRQND